MLGGVRDLTRIVLRQPGVQIVGDAGIEMLAVRHALQDVDVFHREVRLRKNALARQPSLGDFLGLPSRSSSILKVTPVLR